jgi:parallel beta-helix repeat protein
MVAVALAMLANVAQLASPSLAWTNEWPTSCSGVRIPLGSDIQGVINAYPLGTTFCLDPGIFRLSNEIVPKSYDTITGSYGTVLNGSVVLNTFTAIGGAWVASGPVHQPAATGVCATGTACQYSDWVFVNNVSLNRVMSLSALVPGAFFVDYAGGRVYFGSNPSGQTVEYSVAPFAIHGYGGYQTNVSVQNLVVEKFANVAATGAIQSGGSWLIQNNEVRLNHGVGIYSQSNDQVINNYVHDNGELGLAGAGDSILVQWNELAFNNARGFEPDYEAGGAKWVTATHLTVKNNYSHDNNGPGLWSDGNCRYVTYDGNTVDRNQWAGIVHEISYDATISNNTVRGNTANSSWWSDGAGIIVTASPNVEVYANTVQDNRNGIVLYMSTRNDAALFGPHINRNDYVHDNNVRMQSGATGMINYTADNSYYTSQNNRFVHDTYYLGSGSNQRAFYWDGTNMTIAQFQAAGQDTTGSAN